MAVNYLSYTLQIHDDLQEITEIIEPYRACEQVPLWIDELNRLDGKLQTMRFQVAVVGEFKRGKTSFINALLRKAILPADVVPATATINRITYGTTPNSYIHWKDGRPVEKIQIDQLADYITKITDSSAATAREIKEAVVQYPCRFCENNVDLIDTPGMNDDDVMNSVTIQQLSEIDLAIVMLDPNMPVSNTEVGFIAQLVESDQICQIIFVVSKMDTVFGAQRERLLQVITERLQKCVKEELLKVHAEDDEVMEKYREIFTEPILFPISAMQALHAYEMGDQEELEASGFQRLSDELLPLIINTQHSASVLVPLNTGLRVSREFLPMLRRWQAQTSEENNLEQLRNAFASVAYDAQPNTAQIWTGCLDELNRLRDERSSKVYADIHGFILQNNKRREVVVSGVKELFQGLNASLQQEERGAYLRAWQERLLPWYTSLCERLKAVAQEHETIWQEIEPDWRELTDFSALPVLFPEQEPFYWIASPVPPENMPTSLMARSVNSAVRDSFVDYYQRRSSRLAEFLRVVIETQENRITALVQKLFQLARPTEPSGDHPSVDRETLERLEDRLGRYVERCSATKARYIKESTEE